MQHGFEVVSGGAARRERGRVIGGKRMVALIAFAACAGQFRQTGPYRLDPLRIDFKRGKIGVGKIAVVVGILLVRIV